MTTRTQTAQSQSNNVSLLRNTLRANGVFSVLSGLLLVAGAGMVTDFMGINSPLALAAIGGLLLLHALNLFRGTAGRLVDQSLAWTAIIGDVLWVVGSAAILLTDAFSLTTDGKWAVLIVADVVLVFAVLQYIGLRRIQ